MRTLSIVLTLSLLSLLTAATAEASAWSFITYDDPTFAMCTGEPLDESYDPSCSVETNWDTRVQASESQGLCQASITCPPDPISGIVFVKTCVASLESDGFPGNLLTMCYASSSQGGDHKAVCKSSLYRTTLRCG